MKTIRHLMLLLPLLCTIGRAGPAVIWREDFARYADGAHPGRYHDGKGVVLSEGAQKFYRFPGGFMGGFDYFGARHWNRCDVRFKLRPQGNFTLYLVAKSGGWRGAVPYSWYYLTISPDRVAPAAHGLPAEVTNHVPAVAIEPPLATNVWYAFDVAVAPSNIAIRVQGPDEQAPRLLWDHAVLPGGGGIDFHGTPPFDLAEIVVTEP
jgi:hypothetical protein